MAVPGTFTTGQVLTAAEMNDLPAGIVASVRSTSATATVASGAITAFITSSAFTPVAGRKYRVTYNVGYVYKTTGAGNIYIALRLGTGTGGTVLDEILHSTATLNQYFPFEKTTILTSAELGTSSTQLTVTVDTNSNSAQFTSSSTTTSNIIVEDIGT